MIRSEIEDRQYRRGVVLGLTMAEVLILLIFLLLMLAAAWIVDERNRAVALEHETEEAQKKLDQAEQDKKDLENKLRRVQEKLDALGKEEGGEGYIDITKSYAEATARVMELEKELQAAETALVLRDEARKLWGTDPDPEERMKEAAAAVEGMAGKLRAAGLPSDMPNALSFLDSAVKQSLSVLRAGGDLDGTVAALHQCEDQAKQLADKEGQVLALQKQCAASGKGMVLPPCWPDENGQPQYIFDVQMSDSGLVVSDNKVRGREAEQSALNISGFRFGPAMTAAGFRTAGQPVYDDGDRRNCRYYVRLFDETSSISLSKARSMRDAVEAIFYIRRMW